MIIATRDNKIESWSLIISLPRAHPIHWQFAYTDEVSVSQTRLEASNKQVIAAI